MLHDIRCCKVYITYHNHKSEKQFNRNIQLLLLAMMCIPQTHHVNGISHTHCVGKLH